MVFLDTSALVKVYLGRPGGEAVKAVVRRFDGFLYLSGHVGLEVLATFAYKLRDRTIDKREYRKMRSAFLADYPAAYNLLSVTDDTVATAMQLADAHRGLGVGSLDLIHVATVLHARRESADGPSTVVCADRSMRRLASAAGFAVFDPETDDPASLSVAPT